MDRIGISFSARERIFCVRRSAKTFQRIMPTAPNQGAEKENGSLSKATSPSSCFVYYMYRPPDPMGNNNKVVEQRKVRKNLFSGVASVMRICSWLEPAVTLDHPADAELQTAV
mmetsp:Transcript_21831/g.62622  ORF Transcript_21831/g.62622 Transcript_21831/m.62622 type:complete len:113 (+) Transcript_21831:965-1303(+)